MKQLGRLSSLRGHGTWPAGMFARACQTTSSKGPVEELLGEVQEMRKMLVSKLAGVYRSLDSEGSSAPSSVWSSEDETEAVTAAVAPKLARVQEDVKRLLFEVVTLEVKLFSCWCSCQYRFSGI